MGETAPKTKASAVSGGNEIVIYTSSIALPSGKAQKVGICNDLRGKDEQSPPR
jgi:hypothetical protein